VEIAAVLERVERLAGAGADGHVSKLDLEAGLVAAREVDAWVESRRAAIVTRLAAVDSFPEATIAKAAKTSVGKASRSAERAGTLVDSPRLAEALGDGAVTAGHVDAVTRAGKQLDEGQRAALFDRVESLVEVAAAATVEEFDRRVRLEADRVRSSDGMDRLERQRRDTRLRSWVGADGMWNLNGRFDPVTGVRLAAKLEQTVDTLFAETTPDHAPDDPVEKQRFLDAQALARLVQGSATGGRKGRAEILAVIDASTSTGAEERADALASQVSWRIPVEIPARVLAEFAASGDVDVVGVVVCNGVVLHAPGSLDQGRSTRLANRAQRRALRAMYATCGIPGCATGFDRCEIHHIIWWRNGGRTDLANLLPVCTRHHAKIHNDGWTIALGPNRELTLTLPDGTVMATGPPTIRAA
jgi:hypothetical protein